MSDQLFNVCMVAFASMMVWVAFYKPIHTGFFGSIGCLGMAGASMLTIDDSMYNSVHAVEAAILLFCGSVGLVVLHVVLMVARATTPQSCNTPHRRRTDWSEFDERAHAHQEKQ